MEIRPDQARAINDLRTASRKLAELFREAGKKGIATQIEATAREAREEFDALKEELYNAPPCALCQSKDHGADECPHEGS